MKRLILWTAAAAILMVGCPALTVLFAGENGMAICFLLFFAADPLFSVSSGIAAGRNIKQLWSLPLITAGMFLIGVWALFDFGEPAFALYAVCYLLIGFIAMGLTALITQRKNT